MTPPNRLIESTSPYLLQHAHNPVDWYPWGEEAFRKARAEDKPIFLSVGYSACHWCHVMEEESFEHPAVAEVLNRAFVAVKVDREERPDLDDLYMGAVHAIAGRGGWPMSVWLTPDLKPFYGGTYFPRESRFGFPGFIQVLESIAEAWREKRSAIAEDSRRLTEALQRQAELGAGTTLPGERVFEEVLAQLRRTFDPEWGGFGGAPKFPPFLSLDLLFRRGHKGDRKMALRTLDAMAEGGIYDHLGGGFARYSVDGRWLVPHFEKMLYDNAQLVDAYLAAFRATGSESYARIARETLDYLLGDLRDGAGGFHSSEDADSEGEEGRFYVFTPAEVEAVLGPEDGALFCRAFGVTAPGCFEGGRSVLHRFEAPEELRGDPRLDGLRARMAQARARRVRPRKDDKVLASWNGLALSALAAGHQTLDDVRYLEAAVACAEFLQRELWRDGVLLRSWRQGTGRGPSFLEDDGAVAIGLVDLYESTFDGRWLDWAEAICEGMRRRYEDPAGGFFVTREDQSDVILRQKPALDQSLPSANALALEALLRVGYHRGRKDFLESAERALVFFAPVIQQAPRAALGLLRGLDLALHGPVEIVVAGEAGDPETMALLRTVWRSAVPRRLVALVPPGGDRAALQGRPAAYVCTNRACQEPVNSPEALQTLLSVRQF